MTFNREQLEAINDLQNNLLVLAPAGTGKTMVIGSHIELLCKAGKAAEEEVMCITFTNRACNEMLGRINLKNVDIRTMCRFYYLVVQKNYQLLGYTSGDIMIVDPPTMADIVDEIARGLKAPSVPLARLFQYYNWMCEESPKVTSWLAANVNVLANTYKRNKLGCDKNSDWYTWLRTQGASFMSAVVQQAINQKIIDYSLLAVFTEQLSHSSPALATMEYVKYLIVDEVQDTSRIEYEVLTRFFPNAVTMFCGDFNQTIYSWRGSDPTYLLKKYREDYKPHEIMLFENYRSTQALNYLAQSYLDAVSGTELAKLLEPPTEKQKVYLAGRDFAHKAVEVVKAWHEENPDKTIAVLARNRSILDNIKAASEADGCAFRIGTSAEFEVGEQSGMRLFKDLLAVSANPCDDYTLQRVFSRFGVTAPSAPAVPSDATVFAVEHRKDYYDALFEALTNKKLVVFDLETTSKHVFDARIVQIAALNPLTKETYEVLVKPDCSVGASADVHGFTDEFLDEHGGNLREAIQGLLEFASGAVIAGHNIWYDLNVLAEECARTGLPQLEPVEVYDTLRESRKWIHGLPNYRLDTVREKLGVKSKATHNAMDDVNATSGVLSRLIAWYIGPNKEVNHDSVYSMYKERQALLTQLGFCFDQLKQGQYSKVLEWCDSVQRARNFDMQLQYIEAFNTTALTPRCRNQELYMALQLKRSEIDILMKKQNKIPAITTHQSKGCEFDKVVLIDFIDHFRQIWGFNNEREDDEEARVFYVGYTRGREEVIIVSNADSKWGASEYVRKLPEEYVEFIEVKG